jgi:hypothetical protein
MPRTIRPGPSHFRRHLQNSRSGSSSRHDSPANPSAVTHQPALEEAGSLGWSLRRGKYRGIVREGRRFADCETFDRHHRDVIRLAKMDGCLHNGSGRLGGNCFGPIEAEQLAFLVLGFDDTVGIESEATASPEFEARGFVSPAPINSEGQRTSEFDLPPIKVRG